ncbi:MAG: hypothetical protein ABL940_10780 [Bacteroidia bacterium]
MDIYDFIEKIETKKDFDIFLEMLLNNLRNNETDWENNNLENYVDGIYGFTGSLNGYYMHRNENINLEKPTWKMIATILVAARNHE